MGRLLLAPLRPFVLLGAATRLLVAGAPAMLRSALHQAAADDGLFVCLMQLHVPTSPKIARQPCTP
jgi:hypothetical protein